MCVVVLLGQALAHLGRRYPSAAVTILLADVRAPGDRARARAADPVSAGIPALYQTIARDPRPQIRVLELPVGVRDGTSSMGDFSARTQYFQSAHGKAIIGGYLSRVSPRRRLDVRRTPVLNALVALSEGQALTPEQDAAAHDRADEFLRRSRLGYVVIDETRASPALVAFASDLLGLTLVSREGPMSLYVPRIPPPSLVPLTP